MGVAEQMASMLALRSARRLVDQGVIRVDQLAQASAVIREELEPDKPKAKKPKRTFRRRGPFSKRSSAITDERGKSYGPLRVVEWWGMQSQTNAAWVCVCNHCDALCKRLGTHLRNGRRVFCPGCGATKRSRSRMPDPDPERLLGYLRRTGGEVLGG